MVILIMRKLYTLLGIALLFINLCGCSNNKIARILEENGYSNVNVEQTVDLNSDVKGLESGDNQFVLFNSDNGYDYCAVNLSTRRIHDISSGYTPLMLVQNYILSCDDLSMNTKCFEIAHSYIKEYGIECFKEQSDITEEYLAEITGYDGVVDTSTAQEIIKGSLAEIMPDSAEYINTAEETDVIFETGTANPIYYAVKSQVMTYNWTGIFDESVYKVWEANTDLSTQRTMGALYGPPYTLNDVWVVVDKDLQRIGEFNSLDDIKNELSNNPKETNSLDTNTDSTNTNRNVPDVGNSEPAMKIGDIIVSKGDIEVVAEAYMAKGDFDDSKDLAVEVMEEAITSYAVAQANGLTLTEDEELSVAQGKADFAIVFGSASDYKDELNAKGGSDDIIEAFIAQPLYEAKLGEKAAIAEPTDDEAKEYFKENYGRAKHVLLRTDTGEDKDLVKSRAENILERARNGENFDYLVNTFCEDPGSASAPDGYIFTDGEMIDEFEEAVKSIQPGEFTMCESSYGYHIIQRLPLDESDSKFNEFFEQYKEAAKSAKMDSDLKAAIQTMADEAGITVEIYNDVIDTISLDN